jgi:hypothetical protein
MSVGVGVLCDRGPTRMSETGLAPRVGPVWLSAGGSESVGAHVHSIDPQPRSRVCAASGLDTPRVPGRASQHLHISTQAYREVAEGCHE